MTEGICKLCLEYKPLLNHSHIISDFMYESLYDDDHRFIAIPNPKVGNNYSKGFGIKQSGEWEGQILCEDCDKGKFGKLEDYTKQVLQGGDRLRQINHPKVNHYQHFSHVTNIDYQKFKMFILSLFWRASISSRPFFEHFSLYEHEEVIRNMLDTGSPHTDLIYPIRIASHRWDEESESNYIFPPTINHSEGLGLRVAVLPANGLVYYLGLGTSDDGWEGRLRQSNEMDIFHIPDGKDFVDQYAHRVMHG